MLEWSRKRQRPAAAAAESNAGSTRKKRKSFVLASDGKVANEKDSEMVDVLITIKS